MVEEVRGLVGKTRFPFVYRWAYSDPECAHNPAGVAQAPKLPEVGTTQNGTLLPEAGGLDWLAVASTAECAQVAADVVVFDGERSRDLAFPNLKFDVKAAATRVTDLIRAAKVKVELRGVRGCEAAVMWGRVP